MEYIPGLKKSFIVIGITILVVVIFMLIYFNMSHFNNKFMININGVELNSRFDSEYLDFFMVKGGSSGYIKSVGNMTEVFNFVGESDEYNIGIYEYEAYDKFNHREDYNAASNPNNLVGVFDSPKHMKISRMGEVLYDGEFKNDLTDIIKENGRYYFEITNKSKRETSPLAYVNTKFHFSVLIGDKNEE